MLNFVSVLIALGINAVIVDIFVGNFIANTVLSFIVSFMITLACISLFFTPMGTWVMRMQTRLQQPTELERHRIDPIFADVYEKAKLKSPKLPKDIQWFILGDDDLNAFAVGLHTIGIHTGLLQHCSDSEIAAVLAHEFGHIAHRDTISAVITAECNFVVMTLKCFILLFTKIAVIAISFLWSLVSESKIPSILGGYIASFACWFINMYISVAYHICIAPSYASKRQQEYAADKYAAELGIYRPLITFLSRFPTPSLNLKLTLAQMLYGTHPKNEDRIAKLQEFIQQ